MNRKTHSEPRSRDGGNDTAGAIWTARTVIRTHRFVLLSAATLLGSLSGALAGSAQIAFEEVVSGLDAPVAITHAGDGSGRLFITEQGGAIRIYDGALRLTPFLNISSLLSTGGERGLLSVAFDPDYSSNGRFYVFYTNTAGNLVISRYTVSSDPNLANTSGTILLTIPHPGASNHNGGQLQFGPDGRLYIGTGDGGGGGDPAGNAQNLGILLGKLLRINVGPGSLVPADNPFVDGDPSTLDEIWAYGLRNPWRFSFDRQTGDMILGDVGQDCWEEVDFQPGGDPGGMNYGWATVEGSRCYDPPSCAPPPTCMNPSFTSPVVVYCHSDPADCAVTGGYRYRGSQVPDLAGTYIYGDYCSGKLWGATPGPSSWTTDLLYDTSFSISTFGEDEAGEIYVADAQSGRIYRIVAPAALTFSDDFNDGDASDWTAVQGQWSAASGDLSNAAGRRAEILAPYAGCTLCTIDADLSVSTKAAKVSLLGWYRDARNYVELKLSEKADHLTLRRVRNGQTVFSRSVSQEISTGVPIHVSLARTPDEFSLFVDGGLAPVLTISDTRSATGTVGFRVKGYNGKKASGALLNISVN